MEEDVKRHFHRGRHARAIASGVDPTHHRCPVAGRESARHHRVRELDRGLGGPGSRDSVIYSSTTSGDLGDWQADMFSASEREPSFHQGL